MAECRGNGSRGHHGFVLYVWQNGDADIANNKHNVAFSFDLYALVNGYDWNFSSSSPVGYRITINGTQYSGDIWQYGGSGTKNIHSGNLDVYHNSDGTKSIDFSFEVWDNKSLGYLPGYASGSGSLTLDTIPRYANITGFSVSQRDETSVSVSWTADAGCDWAQYRINDGGWVDLPNSGIISGLSANTSYKFAIRVKRSDSQLWTESWNVWQSTYDYPKPTSVNNFTIGEGATVALYNPLGRNVTLDLISNVSGGVIGTYTGTYSGNINAEFKTADAINRQYASIPNANSGTYYARVKYGNVTKTSGNATYSTNKSVCNPTFSTFTYKDSNTSVVAITGNDQILIQNLSTLEVKIASANKMTTKYSATPKKYTFAFGGASDSKNYSTSDITSNLGTITSSGNTRLNVVAYDSRDNTATAYKDINVMKYSVPVINIEAVRLNNWEASTTLRITGTYEKLSINNTDKNTIQNVRYRYREAGGTWNSWVNATYNAANGAFTATDITLSLDNSKIFEIEVEANDKFNSVTATGSVDVGQAIFFISSNNKACYINGQEILMYDVIDEWTD